MENWDRTGKPWWWGFISDIKSLDDNVLIASNGNGLFIINNGNEQHSGSNGIPVKYEKVRRLFRRSYSKHKR